MHDAQARPSESQMGMDVTDFALPEMAKFSPGHEVFSAKQSNSPFQEMHQNSEHQPEYLSTHCFESSFGAGPGFKVPLSNPVVLECVWFCVPLIWLGLCSHHHFQDTKKKPSRKRTRENDNNKKKQNK